MNLDSLESVEKHVFRGIGRVLFYDYGDRQAGKQTDNKVILKRVPLFSFEVGNTETSLELGNTKNTYTTRDAPRQNSLFTRQRLTTSV